MTRTTCRYATAALLVVLAAAAPGIAATADPTAKVVARYPAENGSMVETTVISPRAVADVSPPRQLRGGQWGVPVTLTQDGAESFADALVSAGFTSEAGTGNCPAGDGERNDEGYCLLTVVDGDVVYSASLGPSLARALENGDFQQNPQLLLAAENESAAARLARAFGAAPANATTTTSPTANDESGDGGEIPLPTDAMVMEEIEFYGSFGMPPSDYGELFGMVEAGKLDPDAVVSETIGLSVVSDQLARMTDFDTTGIPVVDDFHA